MRLSLAYEVCVANFFWGGGCKKERKAFYTLRPTPTPHLQPWPLNGGSQLSRIVINPRHLNILSWDLS
jgi:hypothetical protein